MKIPFAQCFYRWWFVSVELDLVRLFFFTDFSPFVYSHSSPFRLKRSFFTRISKDCSHSIWAKHLENHPAWNGGRKRVEGTNERVSTFFHFSFSLSRSQKKRYMLNMVFYFVISLKRMAYCSGSPATICCMDGCPFQPQKFVSFRTFTQFSLHTLPRLPIFITFFPVLTFLRCSHITRNHFYRMFLFIFTASYFMCVCIVVRWCLCMCLCVCVCVGK